MGTGRWEQSLRTRRLQTPLPGGVVCALVGVLVACAEGGGPGMAALPQQGSPPGSCLAGSACTCAGGASGVLVCASGPGSVASCSCSNLDAGGSAPAPTTTSQ
ncbi:MAG: hypothetical protein OXR73_13875, partial [Myxococcales bacterium]|nr:hypothetical protein [Myxococcales bacterium]